MIEKETGRCRNAATGWGIKVFGGMCHVKKKAERISPPCS